MPTPEQRRRLIQARRARSRLAVQYYLTHRSEMLRRLGASNRGDLRAAYQGERARLVQGHWSASWDRLEGLRQALLAERVVALAQFKALAA